MKNARIYTLKKLSFRARPAVENDDDIKEDGGKVPQKKRRKACASVDNIADVNASEPTKTKKLSELCIIASQTCIGNEKTDQNPSARWGHTLSMMSENEAILIGGQGDRNILCKDAVWQLDLVHGKWSVPEVHGSNSKPEARTGHSAVYDPMVRSLYVFGGSKNKRWFSDVHTFDTDTWTWNCVRANGSAPTRSYHSCTIYGHEMWIFGGVFPRPDPEPDGCSNDIYVFSLFEEMWYMPLVMGEKPPARSGHSATLFDNKLVVFGGWDAPVCYNDIYILDLSLVEWSKPKVKGKLPSPRSWHASCALSGNRLFIHGGYNGNNVLDDSFIFNLDTLTWTSVKIEPSIAGRTGHVAFCLPYRYETSHLDKVLMFGGGDNEGKFFAELFSISVPTKGTSLESTASM